MEHQYLSIRLQKIIFSNLGIWVVHQKRNIRDSEYVFVFGRKKLSPFDPELSSFSVFFLESYKRVFFCFC